MKAGWNMFSGRGDPMLGSSQRFPVRRSLVFCDYPPRTGTARFRDFPYVKIAPMLSMGGIRPIGGSMKEVSIGIIGTGWCGGIRAEICAASPDVRELHMA